MSKHILKLKFIFLLCGISFLLITLLNLAQQGKPQRKKSFVPRRGKVSSSMWDLAFENLYDSGIKKQKIEINQKLPRAMPLLGGGKLEQDIIEEGIFGDEENSQPVYPVLRDKPKQTGSQKNEDLVKEALLNVSDRTQVRAPSDNIRADKFMGKVVYNRVGKCGSRSMLTIIKKLAVKNKFTFYSSQISNLTRPNAMQVRDVSKIVYDLPTPSLYSRHIHYVDFKKYGMVAPVYINMIRDPIERFSSQYHFKRYGDDIKSGIRINGGLDDDVISMNINECVLKNHPECTIHGMTYIIAYFCGQLPMCTKGNIDALQMAKQNLIKNYLVVGYLEDFEGMLKVSEALLPDYFKGAYDVWRVIRNQTVHHTATVNKTELSPEAYKVLRSRLKLEYVFYDFTKSLFMDIKKRLGIV